MVQRSILDLDGFFPHLIWPGLDTIPAFGLRVYLSHYPADDALLFLSLMKSVVKR